MTTATLQESARAVRGHPGRPRERGPATLRRVVLQMHLVQRLRALTKGRVQQNSARHTHSTQRQRRRAAAMRPVRSAHHMHEAGGHATAEAAVPGAVDPGNGGTEDAEDLLVDGMDVPVVVSDQSPAPRAREEAALRQLGVLLRETPTLPVCLVVLSCCVHVSVL